MGRWGIVLAVCAGVVVGWLVVPSPDTGKAVPEFKPRPASAATAEVPSEPEAVAPAETRTEKGELPARPAGTGDPPSNEVAQASRGIAGWQRISRKLGASTDAGAPELKAEIDTMVDDLKAFRADPSSASYDDLAARQRDLVGRVRQTGTADASIDSSLERIEQALNGEIGTTPELSPARPAGLPMGGMPGGLPMKGGKLSSEKGDPSPEAVEVP